ncbi:AMP-binding enzyme, partial [Microbulbifer halophilus]|uniref:AMP-binding enzyme n=1 Tax=Microbulbifer halophilus TaxID=453963 RepID=UPI0036197A8A
CTAPATWCASGRTARANTWAATISRSSCAGSASRRARSRSSWFAAPVDRAVVVLREDAPGGKCLMGYVLPERVDGEARAIDTELLRSRLRRTLPDYMVPAQFAILDRWPLNANGKLDRGALPAPGWQPRGAYTAPRSELEVKLADL